MSDLTVTHGSSANWGGGVMVYSGAALALTNCTLSGNSAGVGGGVLNDGGTITLTNCTLHGNKALSGGGGGLSNYGTATLTNCTLSRNSAYSQSYFDGGGGIENDGTARLTNCTLSGNSVRGVAFGGGLLNEQSSTATLTNCTLSGNSALGYVAFGGGIANAGTATLTNCTLDSNRAAYGGGIENVGTARLTNCTLSGNRAFLGDGLYHNSGTFTGTGPIVLINCTIRSHGRGGGVYCYSGDNSPGAGVTLTNTIIAESGTRANCRRCSITSGGHNLSSDATCFASGGSDLLSTDPHLARLGHYGGPTQTLALCTGPGVPAVSCTAASPAIDAGDDSVTGPPDNLTTDQRGLPRLSGAHVDIGADEAQQ